MGLVFLARQAETGREGALKVLAQGAATSSQGARRLRREVQALRRLHHPRVVSILDEHLAHEPPFFVMELLTGGSLQARLESPGSNRGAGLPASELPLLMLELAEALEVIHAEGVLHRDLKPQNVLFTEDGRSKLADFGLAWAVDLTALTATGVVLGTWAYVAPETLRGLPFTPQTDLYQLGVTIFEAATGVQPYTTEQLRGVLAGEPMPPFPALEPLAPEPCRKMPWLPALLQELTNPLPQDRPVSAAALRKRLEGLLDKSKEKAAATMKTPSMQGAPPGSEKPRARTTSSTAPTQALSPDSQPLWSGGGAGSLGWLGRSLPAIPVGLAVVLVGLLLGLTELTKPWGAGSNKTPASSRYDDDLRGSVPGGRAPSSISVPDRVTVGVDSATLWYAWRADSKVQVTVAEASGREFPSREFSALTGHVELGKLQPGRLYSVAVSDPRTRCAFPVETLKTLEGCGLPVLDDGIEAPQFLALASSERSAAVLWTCCGGGDTTRSMRLRQSYDAGRTWTSIEELETAQSCLMSPMAAFSAGSLLVAWMGYLGTPEEVAFSSLDEIPAPVRPREPALVKLGGDLVGLRAPASGPARRGPARFYYLTRPTENSPRLLARVERPASPGHPGKPETLVRIAVSGLPDELHALADVSLVEAGGRTFVFGIACDRSQYGQLCWGLSPAAGSENAEPPSLRAVSSATDVRHCSAAALLDRVVVVFESQGSVRARALGLDGEWLGPEVEVESGGAVPALTVHAGSLAVVSVGPSERASGSRALRLARSPDGLRWARRDLRPWDLPAPRQLAVAATAETLVIATVTAGGQLVALAVEPDPRPRSDRTGEPRSRGAEAGEL